MSACYVLKEEVAVGGNASELPLLKRISLFVLVAGGASMRLALHKIRCPRRRHLSNLPLSEHGTLQKRFSGLLPGNQGQHPVLTVLNVPYSQDDDATAQVVPAH